VSRQSDPGSPLKQIAAASTIHKPFLAQFICSLNCNDRTPPESAAVIRITSEQAFSELRVDTASRINVLFCYDHILLCQGGIPD
jgi:hypothetical protein